MAFEFKLPDIGEGIAEGEVTRWHVKEGQAIKEDDPFVEVMTDKATVEIPAPRAGVIQKLLAKEGETVPVGSVICVIDAAGGAPSAEPAAAGKVPAQPVREPEPAAKAPARPVREPEPATASASSRRTASSNGPAAAPRTRAVEPVATGGSRILAAPAVRRRARESGVDLREVPGSGPAGRVTRGDFEEFLARKEGASLAPVAEPSTPAKPAYQPQAVPAGDGEEERIPLRGIRKRIADRMARSKHSAAHFTYVDEVDVTELVELRESLKQAAASQNVKLTYMPFIVQAVVGALRKFPMLNASLDEVSQEIVVKHYFHIGFAADTDNGLVVPVIKHADQRSILGLGAAIADLAERARAGKLALEEVTGSTFTITNAGNLGGILATPIINHPEVAILGVHKIQDRAVVKGGEIVVRKMMNLSISLDHRLIDGADGARFMNEVIHLLEEPKLLLLGTV